MPGTLSRSNPRIIHRKARITTTGSAGSATGSAELGTGPGVLRFIKADYHASAPATTDVTLTDGDGGTTKLTLGNTATDIAIRAVAMPGVDEANGAIAATDGTAGGIFFRNGVTVEVAQSDALTDALVLDLWFEQLEYVLVELTAAGADGSAVVTRRVDFHQAGIVRALFVDYQNEPATTDLIIKADSSAGETIFTAANTATDIAAVPIGTVAIDEANGAAAATDATDGGAPFRSGLYFDVAQADNFTTNEKIIVGLFIDA